MKTIGTITNRSLDQKNKYIKNEDHLFGKTIPVCKETF